jgi:hypothetical protein
MTLKAVSTPGILAANVDVGVSVITGGTAGNVLYDNAGVLGEYTITGSGTVNVMQTSPTLITPIIGVASGTSLNLTGSIRTFDATTPVTGGAVGDAMLMSATTNLGIYFGVGVPAVIAAQGSLYIRTDGSSVVTRLYVNTVGTAAWAAVSTTA